MTAHCFGALLQVRAIGHCMIGKKGDLLWPDWLNWWACPWVPPFEIRIIPTPLKLGTHGQVWGNHRNITGASFVRFAKSHQLNQHGSYSMNYQSHLRKTWINCGLTVPQHYIISSLKTKCHIITYPTLPTYVDACWSHIPSTITITVDNDSICIKI